MLMGKAHQVKPLFCPAIVIRFPGVFPNLPGNPVSLSVDALHNPCRDLVRLCCLHTETQPVHLTDAPHFQTVGHIPCGAFHTPSGGGGNHHRLLVCHFRSGTVNDPPGSEVVEKAHHLARGVIDIHGAVQDQQVRFQNSRNQRFQLLTVGAAGQVCLETSKAAKTGLIKIPGQKEFLNFAVQLIGQFPSHHAGTACMVLPVDQCYFH